jgi:hypothetical protein
MVSNNRYACRESEKQGRAKVKAFRYHNQPIHGLRRLRHLALPQERRGHGVTQRNFYFQSSPIFSIIVNGVFAALYWILMIK